MNKNFLKIMRCRKNIEKYINSFQKKIEMSKIEPLSIVAIVLMLSGIVIGGIFELLLLIAGAVFISLSFKKFKNNSEYGSKWILYVGAIILLISILLRIIGIGLIALF
jgi:hypothetical protein